MAVEGIVPATTEGTGFSFGDYFGNLFGSGGVGSEGFANTTAGLGNLTNIGTGIFGAMQNQDLINSQQKIQQEQLAMAKDAYARDTALQDRTANLDFTQGL